MPIIRYHVILLMLFLTSSCDGIRENERLKLIEQAKTADLNTAYQLHEQLYASTVPADTTLAPVVAAHGRPARSMALSKAASGSRQEIFAAIPVILATRDTLKAECSAGDLKAIKANLNEQIGSGELLNVVWDRVKNACHRDA